MNRITSLNDFAIIGFLILADGLIGVILLLRMKLTNFNEATSDARK